MLGCLIGFLWLAPAFLARWSGFLVVCLGLALARRHFSLRLHRWRSAGYAALRHVHEDGLQRLVQLVLVHGLRLLPLLRIHEGAHYLVVLRVQLFDLAHRKWCLAYHELLKLPNVLVVLQVRQVDLVLARVVLLQRRC